VKMLIFGVKSGGPRTRGLVNLRISTLGAGMNLESVGLVSCCANPAITE